MSTGGTVSVVVPAHNIGRFIEEAIRSALDQTHSPLEVLVVDDASTDDIGAVLQGLGDPRVRMLRNPTNRGPSFSRNRALAAARGDWLALLDGDDAWLPERLERLLAIAKARESDLVADDAILCDAALRPRGESALGKRRVRLREPSRIPPARFVRWDLGFLKPLIRRGFLAERGLAFDESLRHGEDFELMFRCLRQGARFDLLPEGLYLHRGRAGSLTSERIRLFETTRATTANLLAEPGVAEDRELAAALQRRLRRIDHTLAYNRCRDHLARGSVGRAAGELLRSPGAWGFTLARAGRGIWRRLRPSERSRG